MQTYSFRSSALILLLLLTQNFSFSQWSADPSVNLTVCDTTGEQALAKIATTSDGGTYISWFDNRSGSYAVYLQRLDPLGNKMWDTNGLLISNNSQSTSLVDYELMVDSDDNSVLVFTDTRNSGNLNVFAYRISPSGNFLWGTNGISLSTSSDYQPNPRVTQTNDGSFVVSWIIATNPSKIALQKLSPNGDKLWGTDPVLISSTTVGYNHPFVVPTDSNGVIVCHTEVTGNFPAQTVKLRATKVQANGNLSWMTNIQDLGRIAAFSVPKVYSDKNNGAIIAWHDDRDMNNLQSAFIQRVSSTGAVYYPVNGVELSLMANRQKYNPVAAVDPVTEEVYAFWRETEPNQNQNGISGQKISSAGTRQWTDNGIIFKELSAPFTSSISSLNAQLGNGNAYLFYLEGNGSGLNQIVEGFACDINGGFVWPGNFIILSNETQEKLQMVSAVDVYHNCKLAWGDKRSSDTGIYAQDINPNGQLGNPVIPVELSSFTAKVDNNSVLLTWVTASELNNKGFEIQRENENTWQKIGFVDGQGTTTEANTYTFIINNIPAGTYSYRLKQIDHNGSFEYSNKIEVEVLSPQRFELSQNYPNPFNPSTTISFSIPQSSFVTMIVYDALGNKVSTLINENKTAGRYEINFNASALASGVYYCKMQSVYFSGSIKMLLLK
jgi:hypothetical protein